MGSTAANRQKRYMQRQQARHIVLPIEAHEEILAEMLERAEFLPPGIDHSRENLRQGLQRIIDVWLGSDASSDTPYDAA